MRENCSKLRCHGEASTGRHTFFVIALFLAVDEEDRAHGAEQQDTSNSGSSDDGKDIGGDCSVAENDDPHEEAWESVAGQLLTAPLTLGLLCPY